MRSCRCAQTNLLISSLTLLCVAALCLLLTKQIKTYFDEIHKQRRLHIYMNELNSAIESMKSLEQQEERLIVDIARFKQLLSLDKDGGAATDEEVDQALEKPILPPRIVQ